MNARRLLLLGLAQALGTAMYVALVVLLILVWDRALPDGQDDGVGTEYWGILIFLLLFLVSACITGGLVLGYPAVLAFKQRIRDAALLVAATVGWLVLLLLGLVAVVGFQVIRLS